MLKQASPTADLPPRIEKPRVVAPERVDPNQRYTIPEGSAVLRQSIAKTYKDIKGGKLQVIKDGTRSYLPGSELIRRSTLPTS